jgi:hypothetical protein
MSETTRAHGILNGLALPRLSESQPCAKLQPSRGQHGSWRPELCVGRACDAIPIMNGHRPQEVRVTIDGIHFIGVGAIERIESVNGQNAFPSRIANFRLTRRSAE